MVESQAEAAKQNTRFVQFSVAEKRKADSDTRQKKENGRKQGETRREKH